MSAIQFCGWCAICFSVWFYPFSMLSFKFPWSERQVLVDQKLLDQIPPVPTVILTEDRESDPVFGAKWNIQRPVHENGLWRIELWSAKDFRLLATSIIRDVEKK